MFSAFIFLLGLSVSQAIAPAPRLLILGLGNVGRAVRNEAAKSGYFENRIYGTSRSPVHNDGEILFDPESLGSMLPKCTHVLVTIPPPREKDEVYDAVIQILESKLPRGSWLGFVSTSGVYGNHDGAWVTEESPLYCSEDSPTYRYLKQEQNWRELSHRYGWTCYIFRCAGLYGPARSALHTLWKMRTFSIAPATGITNRIHETDVARAIVASMIMASQLKGCRLYNLSDDEPETRTIVMQYATELLESIGVDISIKETPYSFSSSTRPKRRGTDVKRVSNKRMKRELTGEMVYPTYREGLTAIFKSPSSPWWGE